MIVYHVTPKEIKSDIAPASELVRSGKLTPSQLRQDMLDKGFDLGARLYREEAWESAIEEYLETLGRHVFAFRTWDDAKDFAEDIGGVIYVISVSNRRVEDDPTDDRGVMIPGEIDRRDAVLVKIR